MTFEDDPDFETVYAGCHDCGHIQPRPAMAWTQGPWSLCENCGDPCEPDKYNSYEDAAEAIEETHQHRIEEGRA